MKAPKCRLCGKLHYGMCAIEPIPEKPVAEETKAAKVVVDNISDEMLLAYEQMMARRAYMKKYMVEWRKKQRGKK